MNNFNTYDYSLTVETARAGLRNSYKLSQPSGTFVYVRNEFAKT